ncbi:AbiJ-NTD4 domain-containing protein [Aliiroseovarius crassostreae]|uniref:AbiJ-NTD4 domain-containing protein n=1 Tax=Aliiroseovarius crassostreae TaxID=154981 RepID=UPI002209E831|nr:hypothetical protein [Aliiroseovarius crassostreae]UWQ03681.1 hypothetical protein K3X22_08095 [Aliiroseovarius crassostreae]
MQDFAERFGYRKPKAELSDNEMPSSLRNGLWDCLKLHFFEHIGSPRSIYGAPVYSPSFEQLVMAIQFQFFRLSVDDLHADPYEERLRLRRRFYKFTFDEVYGFIEFLLKQPQAGSQEEFVSLVNQVLSRELAQFRIAGDQFIKITDQNELDEIESAVSNRLATGVARHISAAAAFYSDPSSPDYRNSVKESISAVESAVKYLVDDPKAFGVSKPLRSLMDSYDFHPALVGGFEKIFAYTSDEEGVRHALMDKSKVTQADARFMLVSCSAFANYLIAKKVENNG